MLTSCQARLNGALKGEPKGGVRPRVNAGRAGVRRCRPAFTANDAVNAGHGPAWPRLPALTGGFGPPSVPAVEVRAVSGAHPPSVPAVEARAVSGAHPPSVPAVEARAAYGETGSGSALTSAGSPRSGNGMSIASKSRGTTVAGNVARASSRTSRGK